MAHGRIIDKRGRMVDAILVAQGIKLLFVNQPVQKGGVNVGGDHIFGQGIPAMGRHLYIVVSASQQNDSFIGKLLRHRLSIAAKGVQFLVIRAYPVVDDGAVKTRKGGIFAISDGTDSICLVKGTGHAVYVDVAAEHQRLEGKVVGHKKNLVFIL